MFNNGGMGGGSRGAPSGATPPQASPGSSQAAIVASSKAKRKQASPKAGSNSATLESSNSASKVVGAHGASGSAAQQSLKYVTSGMAGQQNLVDKYSNKTRNKITHTISAQHPGQSNIGNSDSVSSGNGGQPAIFPSSSSRKLQSMGQQIGAGGPYKPQGATSYSPKGSGQSNQAGKLLFAQASSHQQINQAALQSAGMHNFEEATKRQEIMSSSQQNMIGMRNANYMLQRSNMGSKKELLRDQEHSQQEFYQAQKQGDLAARSYTRMQMSGGAEPGQVHGGMSPEYYSRNQRAKGSKVNSPEGQVQTSQSALHMQQQAMRQQASQQVTHNRSKSKQGQLGVSTNFMKRRVSEDKVNEISGKMKPTLRMNQGPGISYQEYLEHNKARSPKIYPSKQLEQLKQTQGAQVAQNSMFNARAMASRPQVSSQMKQYQYLTNSASKSGDGIVFNSSNSSGLAGGKSRNPQVTSTTSQGSLGSKYKTSKQAYAMSPKAMNQMRDSQNRLKYGLKGSPKQHGSPTSAARMISSASQQAGLFSNAGGRNQPSIREKYSMGAGSQQSTNGTNYLRSSGQGSQNVGLSPTAQYKKVLMKGPMPLMAGKVIVDNDDMDDDFEDDDIDESAPVTKLGRVNSQEIKEGHGQASPQNSREKELLKQQRAAQIQSQREQYQKQQRRLLRNIWIATEKGNFQACYDLLSKQDAKLATALLNECNSDGWTPLHVASNEGHVEMIGIFAQFGAHLNCQAKNLRTPLHVACIRGNVQIVRALLQQGADFDAKDSDGNTPCHMISQYGHTSCLELLLKKHPNLGSRNQVGQSPMDVAYNNEILSIFKEYVNDAQHLFSSQQSSSKYSTSSKESGNGSTRESHQKEQNSSKVPKSLSKPERQQQEAPSQQQVRTNQEETKSRSKPTKEGPSRASPAMSSQQRKEQAAVGGGAHVAKQQNINVQIHDSLHTQQKHQKSRSNGQQKEGTVMSNESSQPEEEIARVGPDDFMPLKMLGSGSFGEVYLVREIRTGELYAMKVLTKAKIFGNNLVRYAKTERDVLSYTKHPFIVGLNYAFQTKTKLFLILDFCPGGDLGRVLQREGRLSEERARMYLCEVLLAIEALHKRDIIFRDLKPDNVVIDTDGHACLTDFGLSKEGVFDPSRGAKSFCGSVAYLAPEMVRKAGHGKSVDWYLLGVILYEMIVGQPPYFSESKDQLFNNIQRGVLKLPVSMSQEAKNLIVHLLNRNPSKRLGAQAGGASEIKAHPFFADIVWEDVQSRRLTMPPPRYTYQQFKKQYESFNCTEEQKRQIFEDAQQEGSGRSERVEGWSFVNPGGELVQDLMLEQQQVDHPDNQ